MMRVLLETRKSGRIGAMIVVVPLNSAGFVSMQFYATQYFAGYAGLSPIPGYRLLPPDDRREPDCTRCRRASGLTRRRSLHHMQVCRRCVTVGYSDDIDSITVAGALCTGLASLLYALIDPHAPYRAFAFPAAVLAAVGIS
jgi:hypothetical protein